MRVTDEDDELRARVRAGDRDAFGSLYDAHARAVYNHGLRLTGDWSLAEDVMSETFLAAWRTRASLHPEGGSLGPWLLGIATHKAHNATRRLRRQRLFLSRQPAPPAVTDFAEESAGRIDDARRLAVVRDALSGLRSQDRDVLVLCVWSGLTYQECAEALGIPLGTVRSRLARARRRLDRLSAKNLEPHGPRGEVRKQAAFAAARSQEENR
ncbi:RNA polymerase sigma factor [Streptomyces sp. NRRL F-5527]|uniref:RNA polymerase sigma factor n=1 Tax=Streptomyces sp. NRRL F-5527 TaxID=1463862 RepID=UPI0004C55279|nr:RNA polymerase sigma factor [Streptomyces sp. NRRL F-5527]